MDNLIGDSNPSRAALSILRLQEKWGSGRIFEASAVRFVWRQLIPEGLLVRPDNPENIADIGSVPDNMELIPDPNLTQISNNGCSFWIYKLSIEYG